MKQSSYRHQLIFKLMVIHVITYINHYMNIIPNINANLQSLNYAKSKLF